MRGTIRRRTLADGSRRYDCRYRAAGRQRTKSFTRRKDADRFLAELARKVHDGSYVETKSVMMEEVFDLWLDDLETRVMMAEIKASTASTYRCNLRTHLAPAFKETRSDQLTARAIGKWRGKMAEKIAAGSVAPKSYNNLHTLLHSILTWARHPAQGFMAHDPLIGQKRLKLRRQEAAYLESDGMAALLNAAVDLPEANAVIHLGLFAGLRRGEIFGLQWGDVEDGEAELGGRIKVRRSVVNGQVTTTKTDSSERVVDAPQRVLDVLAAHRATCPAMGEGFIFRTRTGTPIDPGSWYRRTFCKIRKSAQLGAGIGLHALRHTYASLLIQQNENPKYISRQMGHASVAFTMDVYGHIFEETSTEAMERLNSRIPEPVRPELRAVGA